MCRGPRETGKNLWGAAVEERQDTAGNSGFRRNQALLRSPPSLDLNLAQSEWFLDLNFTQTVTGGRDDTSEPLLLLTSYHSIRTMTGIIERKLNPEQSDCNISQDDRSLVSLPNKAESMSHLFLCLPWLPPCWLLPVPFYRRSTSQVHYRKQTLRHRSFGDSGWPTEEMGTPPCSHRLWSKQRSLPWNQAVRWPYSVEKIPPSVLRAKRAGETWRLSHTQSGPQLPGTWSCFALSSIQVRTASRKDTTRSELRVLRQLGQHWTESVTGGATAGDLLLSPRQRWLSHCCQSSKRGLYFLISSRSFSLSWLAWANACLVSISSFRRVGSSFTWGTTKNSWSIKKVTHLANTSSKGTRENSSSTIRKFGQWSREPARPFLRG